MTRPKKSRAEVERRRQHKNKRRQHRITTGRRRNRLDEHEKELAQMQGGMNWIQRFLGG